jgi:hypothetical protein
MTTLSNVSSQSIDYFSASRLIAGNVSVIASPYTTISVSVGAFAVGESSISFGGLSADVLVRILPTALDFAIEYTDIGIQNGAFVSLAAILHADAPAPTMETILINKGTGVVSEIGYDANVLNSPSAINGIGVLTSNSVEFVLKAGDFFSLYLVLSTNGAAIPVGQYAIVNVSPTVLIDDMQ